MLIESFLLPSRIRERYVGRRVCSSLEELLHRCIPTLAIQMRAHRTMSPKLLQMAHRTRRCDTLLDYCTYRVIRGLFAHHKDQSPQCNNGADEMSPNVEGFVVWQTQTPQNVRHSAKVLPIPPSQMFVVDQEGRTVLDSHDFRLPVSFCVLLLVARCQEVLRGLIGSVSRLCHDTLFNTVLIQPTELS